MPKLINMNRNNYFHISQSKSNENLNNFSNILKVNCSNFEKSIEYTINMHILQFGHVSQCMDFTNLDNFWWDDTTHTNSKFTAVSLMLISSLFSCLWQYVDSSKFFADESTNSAAPTTNDKKRALVVDLVSDSEDDSDTGPTQSCKRLATSPVKSQSNAQGAISSTSESPELMIIDLD